VKRRPLPQSAIEAGRQRFCVVVVHWRHVDLDRLGRLRGQFVFGEAAQDRLTADNDYRIVLDALGGGTNGVLELSASHRFAPAG
jgi:hypothetical protein